MSIDEETLVEVDNYAWNKPTPPKPEHHAAVLFRGRGPVICEDFDFWAYTTDKQMMLKIDDPDRLIMAESREKVELMLEARYPTLPGCTMIDG